MNPNKSQEIQVCPECGGSNACQSESDHGTGFSCWCQEVTLSKKTRLELKKRGLSEGCLCQTCIKLLNSKFIQDEA